MLPTSLTIPSDALLSLSQLNATSSTVDIPSFISPPALASLLGVTLRRLAKDARASFPDWWPQSITERRMLRTGYNNVKALILNYEEAAAIARLYARSPQRAILEESDLERQVQKRPVQRAPVIAILGHKDHGKTSLLDSLRGTHIAEREEFGITQETYTFQVTLDEQSAQTERELASSNAPSAGLRRTFTFLDTPGHHSFTEMRAQAAAHADVVLLVVAADEGLLEQSFESLNIITQFTLPIVVCITKAALPNSRPERVRRELQRLGARLVDASRPTLSVRGEMVAVDLSVKEGQGLQELRRALFGVTSLLPLKADANAVCQGRVVEAWREEKGRGDVVRVLVKEGTLRTGDWFVSDLAGGRVKAMRNSRREAVEECGPGGVAELMGADMLPAPGSDFFVCSQLASDAIKEVRRLEQAYPEQDRFAPKSRGRRKAAEEDEEEAAAEASPAAADEESITAEPSLPRSGRSSGAVRSFFSSPKPADRLTAAMRPPAPLTAFDELRAHDDYDPLPVIIKASSRGQLRMVLPARTQPSALLSSVHPHQAALITSTALLLAVVRSQLMDSIDIINKDLRIRQCTAQLTPAARMAGAGGATDGRVYGQDDVNAQRRPRTRPARPHRPLPTHTLHSPLLLRTESILTCLLRLCCGTALILVVESGVGVVTKTDVQYSQAYECPIYAFRVKSPLAREQSSLRRFNIQVHSHSHFQHLIDDITHHMQLQYDRRRVKEGKPTHFAHAQPPQQPRSPSDHGGEEGESVEAAEGQAESTALSAAVMPETSGVESTRQLRVG